MSGLRLRYFGPFVLITICLVLLCTFTAISLLDQQSAVTKVFLDNVESRKAAVELEECLRGLLALENDEVETVSRLHDRAALLIRNLERVADQPEERELFRRLTTAFDTYFQHWHDLPPKNHPHHDAARREATGLLEDQVFPPCEEFELYNAKRIEASTKTHERILQQLAWGLAGVACLGAVAGMVLGYGVARGLAQSIRRLKVQLQDAVGKFGPEFPEIVVTGQGDFGELHAEVDRLSIHIEEAVRAMHARESELLRVEQLAAVGQLAAGVAHEIRNPLTSIKLLVQTSLEAGAPALAGDDLRLIEGEVRRMEKSLQTFLEFARPQKSERKPTDLVALVQDVVGLLQGRAEKQKVAITVDSSARELTVPADREKLRQVLVNLGLNALDAMPTGGKLDLSVRPGIRGRVQLEIADTGPGVAEGILPRLFQPFVSGKETGLGLGLVISKRIVDDHGGTLAAANRPDGGACFFITLPDGITHAERASR